jgi:hypothetical protein
MFSVNSTCIFFDFFKRHHFSLWVGVATKLKKNQKRDCFFCSLVFLLDPNLLRQALRGFGGVNKACFAQPPQCGTQHGAKGGMLGIETKKAIKSKKEKPSNRTERWK